VRYKVRYEEMAAINIRCLDDADADTFRVRKVDGKSF